MALPSPAPARPHARTETLLMVRAVIMLDIDCIIPNPTSPDRLHGLSAPPASSDPHDTPPPPARARIHTPETGATPPAPSGRHDTGPGLEAAENTRSPSPPDPPRPPSPAG